MSEEELAGLEERSRARAERDTRMAMREQELDEREREVAAREQTLESRVQAVEEREQALAARARELQDQERTLAVRGSELGDRESAVAERLADLERREAEVGELAQTLPVLASPPREPVESLSGDWTIDELEHLVETRAAEYPDQADEWRGYLFHLRPHARPDGTLPAGFDALVEEVFGSLLERGRTG